MKIAFLTPEYPHPQTGTSGGIGTSIKNLAYGLIKAGHQVRILVYGQHSDAVFTVADLTIQQIKNVKLKGLSWYLTRKKIERIINELYSNNEIDIVEAPDWTGITSFIHPKKCPIVVKLHGTDTYFCHLDNRKVKWATHFHEKKAIQNATGHISVSQFTANVTNKLFNQNLDYKIIPNGISIESLHTNTTTAINSNKILYFGTLIRKKGLLELSLIFNEVIKSNPKAELHLVGKDSPDKTTGGSSTWTMMQELFSEVAIKNVFYHGPVAYTEIKNQINTASICVFPTFAEALPVSWIEAMAMQKAIIASNIGWATEVIDDNENGLLENPKNHREFARKILELLENKSLNQKIGAKALEKVKSTFDSSVVVQQSVLFYESITKLKT